MLVCAESCCFAWHCHQHDPEGYQTVQKIVPRYKCLEQFWKNKVWLIVFNIPSLALLVWIKLRLIKGESISAKAKTGVTLQTVAFLACDLNVSWGWKSFPTFVASFMKGFLKVSLKSIISVIEKGKKGQRIRWDVWTLVTFCGIERFHTPTLVTQLCFIPIKGMRLWNRYSTCVVSYS